MSPPIRDGSGNSIGSIRLGDGSEISEVRTGAGDVLFSAAPPLPSSAVEQFTATGYDDANDVWVGQLGNFDLSGGTATKTTDGFGNTVVRYDPATSSSHANSNLSLSSPEYVISVVFNNWSADTMILVGSSGSTPIFRKISSSDYRIKTGSNVSPLGGAPNGDIRHALFFGPDSSGEPKLEVDGSVSIARFNSGDFGISGFRIGNRGSQDFLMDGDVLEVVPMQDPSSSELSDERSRVKSKFSGLSF